MNEMINVVTRNVTGRHDIVDNIRRTCEKDVIFDDDNQTITLEYLDISGFVIFAEDEHIASKKEYFKRKLKGK